MEQRLLPIEFLILGGGVAGLCSAITLTRAGHQVTLLERDSDITETRGAAGCRLPPNMTKFLSRWGMEDKLSKLASTSRTLYLVQFESGDILGKHVWQEEILKETGGDYICMHYSTLRKLLFETALENGATILQNSVIQSISVNPGVRPSLELTTGQKFEADVLIGADGASSIARRAVVGQDLQSTFLGMVLYNVVVSGEEMMSDSELAELLEHDTSYSWLGNGRGACGFPMLRKGCDNGEKDYTLTIWIPYDNNPEDGWNHFVETSTLLRDIGDCDQKLRKLASLASSVIRIPISESPELEDWVHEDGHLLLVGDAAHAFFPGSLQAISIAAGDAAALGRIFQHLHHESQIESLLWGFEEIRQKRVSQMREAEMTFLSSMTMLNGPAQEARDARIKRRYELGLNALDNSDGSGPGQWDSVKDTFGYDAEDEADDWWMKWGKLKERAEFVEAGSPGFVIEVNQEASVSSAL
ncbi:FAD/NAD-P-binding domain-containing protein [Abortiporus biennis]|nr:FAD/NAD-P-binding domain-containing protein [Abortiporus biennis]